MQVTGRKLFILYPPSATPVLHRLDTESETVQSPVDPLKPDVVSWPKYVHARPRVVMLRPGEALLVPRGWWHYAASVDTSVTLQRNFYHATTNARGLVQLVLQSVKKIQQQAKTR